jgi:thiol:disulfide interchange protein
LAGGLLLNIMPCVFPILSLKALSLARAGGEERAVRREALAYTAGAVLACLALGAVLLAVRAGGSTVGWAFQLQDPRVILFLLLLVTAVALNLAGLFELPSLGGRLASGRTGAFGTGALAAFVATPWARR